MIELICKLLSLKEEGAKGIIRIGVSTGHSLPESGDFMIGVMSELLWRERKTSRGNFNQIAFGIGDNRFVISVARDPRMAHDLDAFRFHGSNQRIDGFA